MGTSTLSLPSQVRIALGQARSELRARGIQTVITSTFRTRREQQFLFNMFQRGNTAFPVARPGTSRHELGLAVDLVAVPPSDLPEVVTVMRAVGFRWAGPSDSVHFDFVLPPRAPRTVQKGPTGPQAVSVRTSRVSPIRDTGAARPQPPFCFN